MTASTVVRASFGAVRFLLVGDAEAGEEQWLLDNANDLRSDVLKVGHHGSTTSTGDAETLRLQETGADTGVFAGAIQSVQMPPAVAGLEARAVRTITEKKTELRSVRITFGITSSF